MLEEAEARRIAESLLADTEALTDVAENRIGWTYYWNSAAYIETGDEMQGIIGNAPIIIDRMDGSIVPSGTGESVEFYIDQYQDRRAWRKTASKSDLIISDALDHMRVGRLGLPGMTRWELDRLAAIHPEASATEIQAAQRHATAIGERVLELTCIPHDRSAVLETLKREFPTIWSWVWPRLYFCAGAPPTAQGRSSAAPLVRRGQQTVIGTFAREVDRPFHIIVGYATTRESQCGRCSIHPPSPSFSGHIGRNVMPSWSF
jgi:hypothetical protein